MDLAILNGALDHDASGDRCHPHTVQLEENHQPETPFSVSHSNCRRPSQSSVKLEEVDRKERRPSNVSYNAFRRPSQTSVRVEDLDRKERRPSNVSYNDCRRPSQSSVKLEDLDRKERRPSNVSYNDCRGPSQSSARPNSGESSGQASSAHSDLDSEDAMDRVETTHTTEGENGREKDNNRSSVWQSFKKAGTEFNQDTRKMFRYFGRKLNSRHGQRQTKVKEIHILPGEDGDQVWARRIAGSGTSRSSSSSDPSN